MDVADVKHGKVCVSECQQVMIGFGFTLDWKKKWCRVFSFFFGAKHVA